MISYTNLKYIAFSYLIAGIVMSRVSAMAQSTELSPDYEECHDDLKSNPQDFENVHMRFPWLAFLQYVRIKDGMLYHGRVPRVVMIHRQYVLATASDVMEIPEGYSLGNVVFKDYDRDEDECEVDIHDLRAGAECRPSELVMPIVDVILHPEYLDEDNRPPDSIAILKLMQKIQSNYMMPICLPFFDFTKAKNKITPTFIIDFESKSPQVLNEETKYTQKIQVLPTQLCNRMQKFMNVSETHWPLALCASGCGMVRGAPLVSHLTNGWWVLVALASRPVLCTDPNVWRSNRAEPSQFVNVLPYVDWITNTTIGHFDQRYTLKHTADDPFGYEVRRKAAEESKGHWTGRLFRIGPGCFSRLFTTFHYYSDSFIIASDHNGDVQYSLNLQPDQWYKVHCVKVLMPNRFVHPIIHGIGHWNLTIKIPRGLYKKKYEILLDVSSIQASDKERERWMFQKTLQEATEHHH